MELSRVGGLNVKDITRRIMYRIFTNEGGILYSWEGAKKRNPLKIQRQLRSFWVIFFVLFCICILSQKEVFASNVIDYILKDMIDNYYIFFNTVCVILLFCTILLYQVLFDIAKAQPIQLKQKLLVSSKPGWLDAKIVFAMSLKT